MTIHSIERHVVKFLIGWIIGFFIGIEVNSFIHIPVQYQFYGILSICVIGALSFEFLLNTFFLKALSFLNNPTRSFPVGLLKVIWSTCASEFWSEKVKVYFWRIWQSAAAARVTLQEDLQTWTAISSKVVEEPLKPLTHSQPLTPAYTEQLELPLNSEQNITEPVVPKIPIPEIIPDPLPSFRTSIEEEIKREILYGDAIAAYRRKATQKDEASKEPEISDILPPLPIGQFSTQSELEHIPAIPIKSEEEIIEHFEHVKLPNEELDVQKSSTPIEIESSQELIMTENVETSVSNNSELTVSHKIQDSSIKTNEVTLQKYLEKVLGILLVFGLRFIKSILSISIVLSNIFKKIIPIVFRLVQIISEFSLSLSMRLKNLTTLLTSKKVATTQVSKKQFIYRVSLSSQLRHWYDWTRENLDSIGIGFIVVILTGIVILTTISVLDLSSTISTLPTTIVETPEATKPPQKFIQGQRITIDIGEQASLAEAMKKVEKMKHHGYSDARVYLTFDRKVYIHVGSFATKPDARVVGWKLVQEKFTNTFSYVSNLGRITE